MLDVTPDRGPDEQALDQSLWGVPRSWQSQCIFGPATGVVVSVGDLFERLA
jgi:hypothetical protein